MPLWKDGHFSEDRWHLVADDQPLGAGQAILSLARWRSERDGLLARNAPIGLLLPPDAEWRDIAADLPRFPVIAVAIPKFGDGRAFSIARLLRQRDGYAGEIRAIGVYTIDQMPLMRRVGIDAFLVEDELTLRQLERGVWPEVRDYLQPVDDRREVPAGTRPWIRRPLSGGAGS